MVLLETGTPGTSREIYSEDVDGDESSMFVDILYDRNSIEFQF